MSMKNNELLNDSITRISEEMIYYKINDQDINFIKQNNIQVYKDHGNYYCIISMQKLYQLFPSSDNIKIKYLCFKCNKIEVTNCKNITKKLQSCNNNLWCRKCTMHIKRNQTLYKYSTIPTSKQQMYFYNLFKEISTLNYPLGTLHLDVALLSLKIGIEYNGSGHDLNIKLKDMTKQQFIAKEWRRRYILIQKQWKMIYIISQKDKIKNYTNEEYIIIFNYCYYLFQIENEQTIEIYIENNFILTKHSITHITDILCENNMNKIKKMQIFTINDTVKYLHISKKILYSLNNKKILLMNITSMNFRYYTQIQLDKYIQKFHKINYINYYTIIEAAKFLNTTVNKMLLLKYARELYPLIFNSEEYYEKNQLDTIIKNKILDQYFTTKEAAQYLNTTINNLSYWNKNQKLIPLININNQNFYTKDSLNQYKQSYIDIINDYYNSPQACEYLNISAGTLQRRIRNKDIIPIEINNAYYFTLESLNKIKTLQQKDAAKYLSISTHHLNELVNSNKLKCLVINNRRAYKLEDLNEYLNQQKILKQNIAKDYFSLSEAAKYLDYAYKSFMNKLIHKFNITEINNRQYIDKLQIQKYKQLNDNLKINYLTTKNLAKMLHVHSNLISKWKNQKLITPDYYFNNYDHYNKNKVINFIEYMIMNNQKIGLYNYFTVIGAANYIGVDQDILLQWKNNKLIPAININNCYFYNKNQLDQYLCK